MKHVLNLVAFCLLLSPAEAQTLFQSGLESWSEGLPTGFGGGQSTFPPANIQQVNTPVHGGASAMRVDLADAATGLLTTTPLIVTADRLYEVRFWVQGTGTIRVGLFDGRGENAGFSPLTAPVEVNSTSWHFVIRTVLCANSTLAAEFALELEELAAALEQLTGPCSEGREALAAQVAWARAQKEPEASPASETQPTVALGRTGKSGTVKLSPSEGEGSRRPPSG